MHGEQIAVTGYETIGAAPKRSFQELIVFWISARAYGLGRCNALGDLRQLRKEGQTAFCRDKAGELRASKDFRQLFKSRFSQELSVVNCGERNDLAGNRRRREQRTDPNIRVDYNSHSNVFEQFA